MFYTIDLQIVVPDHFFFLQIVVPDYFLQDLKIACLSRSFLLRKLQDLHSVILMFFLQTFKTKDSAVFQVKTYQKCCSKVAKV